MFGHFFYRAMLLATISSPADFPDIDEPKPPVPLVAGHPQCYKHPSTLKALNTLHECKQRLISYHQEALHVDRRRLNYETYLSELDGKVRYTRDVFRAPENREFYEFKWKPRILALQKKYGRDGDIAKHIRIAEQSVEKGLDALKRREDQIRWLPSLPR